MMTATLLDVSVLGLRAQSSASCTQTVREAKALMAPWMTPVSEVIIGRIDVALERGAILLEDDQLVTSESGRDRVREFATVSASRVDHQFAPLVEALKLAFLDCLDDADRSTAMEGLIEDRTMCLAAQEKTLAACPSCCPHLRTCRKAQLLLADAQLLALRRELANDPNRLRPQLKETRSWN